MNCQHATRTFITCIIMLAGSFLNLSVNAQSIDLNAINTQIIKHYNSGEFDKALILCKKFSEIIKNKMGNNHPYYATNLNNLALIYVALGKYTDAEKTYQNSLSIYEKSLGKEHPFIGATLDNLAGVYEIQGRFIAAETLLKHAIKIKKKSYGTQDVRYATSLNNLALIYGALGRYAETEKLLRQSLKIVESVYGIQHTNTAISLNNLAVLYQKYGKNKEAESLLKRALQIRKKTNSLENSSGADNLDNLALLYTYQGRNVEAASLHKRALKIRKKLYGPDHPKTGISLNNLAELYQAQGHYEKASLLLQRALEINKKFFGPHHYQTGISISNLAKLYMLLSKYAEAEKLMINAINIKKQSFEHKHPSIAISLLSLAALYNLEEKYDEAYKNYQIGNEILIKRNRTNRGLNLRKTSQNNLRIIDQISTAFLFGSKNRKTFDLLKQETYKTSQWAISSKAAKALAQMTTRFSTGDTKLASLVRERQDKASKRHTLDEKLIAAVTKLPKNRNNKIENKWRSELKLIDKRLDEINQSFKKDFPDYAALENPEPVSLPEVINQIKSNEALISFLLGDKESYAWVVTKGHESRWVKLPIGRKDISNKVQALRCGLDIISWKKLKNAKKCRKLLKVNYSYKDVKAGAPLPFSLDIAHKLYETLFSQVRELINNKHLLIVADGPLTSLPFQVLVVENPDKEFVNKQKEYRKVTWLGKQHPITVLPSVPSLKALRKSKRQNVDTTNLYIGFGNPLLSGKDGKDKRSWYKQKCSKKRLSSKLQLTSTDNSTLALRSFYRGFLADIKTLKRQSPLPETTDELCAVAQSLGVPESNIYLGKNATESKVKSLNKDENLKDYRYIHFATHGLLSGELKFQAEPALILTPPDVATKQDDGLLTASEVANLKLNADLVILSACNTAAGEKLGAEPFSGLARAFFYAGAKALLVSHWAVDSEATVKLITKSFEILKQNPKLGRAEALRQSMVNLMNDDTYSWNPHPSTWAPFVVVGEGAAVH